jgi:hypothetical protein
MSELHVSIVEEGLDRPARAGARVWVSSVERSERCTPPELVDLQPQTAKNPTLLGELSPGIYRVVAELATGAVLEREIEVGAEPMTVEFVVESARARKWRPLALRTAGKRYVHLDQAVESVAPSEPEWHVSRLGGVGGAEAWDRIIARGNADQTWADESQWFLDAGPSDGLDHLWLDDGAVQWSVVIPGRWPGGRLSLDLAVGEPPEVMVDDPEIAHLVQWLQRGREDIAADAFTPIAVRLLAEKFSNPYAAALGGYTLMRVAPNRFQDIGNWVHRLCDQFEWLPDGAVLHAAAMAREVSGDGDIDSVAEMTRLAYERGVPLFAAGVRQLLELLLVLEANRDDAELGPMLRRVRIVAGRLRGDQVFTTLRQPTEDEMTWGRIAP